jgi:hypothetical protein
MSNKQLMNYCKRVFNFSPDDEFASIVEILDAGRKAFARDVYDHALTIIVEQMAEHIDEMTAKDHSLASGGKPPLGLMPKELYEETCRDQRITDIINATKRFNDENRRIPDAWFDELASHTGSDRR